MPGLRWDTGTAAPDIMTLLLTVLLPFLGAALPAWFIRWGRAQSAIAAGVVAATSFLLLMMQAPAVFGGEVVRASWDWLPQAGLRFSFMLDGLGFLFATLILGIGLLVILYARYYLSEKDPMGRFFSYLLLFMGAMLGVVLSENLILLIIFWELTSLSSFLLIGFWKHLPEARQGARMALVVTGMGGLGLLGGVLLLGNITGTYELGQVLQMGPQIQAHPLYLPALLLILLGAFTKSAQFPFHFWLPHAMAAPTPVSAYLHSATMVKAGVFLLARLWPALAGSPEWFYLVTGGGVTTLLVGAYIANIKHDLKGLLAYSTISHLGLITTLFGFGNRYAAAWGVFHIMNHAAFKASLFMNAGIIDHEAGTRDIRKLGGLRKYMPVTAVLALVAAAAMAGVPPLNGFISKEMFLYSSLDLDYAFGPSWLIPVLVTMGALFSVGYSIRYVMDVFYGKAPASYPHKPHEPPRGMRLPVEFLVVLCVLIGLFPVTIAGPLLNVAANATVGGGLTTVRPALWHGVNPALFMSAIALAVGALVWRFRWSIINLHEKGLPFPEAKRWFEGVVGGLVSTAGGITSGVQNGSLQRYMGFIILTAVVLTGTPLVLAGAGTGSRETLPVDAGSVVALLVLLVGAFGTMLLHRRRITAILFMSVVGLVLSLTFVHFSAPDLALTQISVEVVTVVLLLLALHLLPKETPAESSVGRRVRDGVLASAAGMGIAALSWIMLTRPVETISSYHLEQSKPLGGGTNVVNVILVDFRGFDTFGEIVVLGIAALGIYALLDGLGIPARWRASALDDEGAHPILMVVIARLLLPLALMVGLYLFLRGHAQPGGGFIAGLVVAVALILQYVASGIGATQDRMKLNFHPMIAAGILAAGLTGVGAWFWGYSFLKSWYGYFEILGLSEFELASAALFDVGVFLTVVGAVMLALVNMGKLPEAESVVRVNGTGKRGG